MSSNGESDSVSGEEDLRTTGLIATRAKRSTAGNLYATLRQNLDDEELQKELLAEDEEDVGDYEGSDKDGDDDEAMESSDDDEDDDGPPKEGVAEELEGERELKRTERVEARRKRKLEQAKMRIAGWRQKKRVKLADDAKTEDGTPERPKKKSERSGWLATGIDAPIRQSERASAVASREITHAHLKQSAARSEKQRKVMKNAAERERANKRALLTQEERLAKAARVEKETSREFGRWEREEAERQRIREEQLAAKRRRGFEGPVVRYWSGSVLWEGDKVTIRRLHGSGPVDEIKGGLETADSKDDIGDAAMVERASNVTSETCATRPDVLDTAPSQQGPRQSSGQQSTPATVSTDCAAAFASTDALRDISMTEGQTDPPQTTWLQGIHEYAAQPTGHDHVDLEKGTQSVQGPEEPMYMPSAPSIHIPAEISIPPIHRSFFPATQQQPLTTHLQHPSAATTEQAHSVDSSMSQQSKTNMYHVWPSGVQQIPAQQSLNSLTPIPTVSLVREQAQRSLVMLEQFAKLDTPVPTKRGYGRGNKDAALEPNVLASTLFPASYPSFSPEETRYLTMKMRKRGPEHVLPPAPVKARCAVTSWPAKFRDPKTGLPYAELQTYKMIQRLLAGGCAWSRFLGAWVGPTYGSMGRPAKGVPSGFAAPPLPKPTVVQAEVKNEATDVPPQ